MVNYSRAHLCQCLSRLATVKRNSVVTITGDRRKTGEGFVQGVLSLARGLIELGVLSGDVVAISSFNSDGYLEWLLAVAYIGGIIAPINYRWSFKEACLAMSTIRPVMLVTDESCNHWYSELQSNAIPSLKCHVSLGSPSSDFIKRWNILTADMLKVHPLRSSPLNCSWAPEDAVIVCFTSGSTGRPKGVMISHSALIVQSLAKIAIVGYGLFAYCSVMPHWWFVISYGHANEQHCVTSLITVPAIMADLVTLIRVKKTWKGRDNIKKILNGGGGLSIELTKMPPNASQKLSFFQLTE
ncbi:hypothetical protein LWI28_002356 [Acer negundo]|uniref:AMP-dependent synthetase/ligase domain-containing protein n=1 Tax=Acer negundo TaxID=4023 RepID=A0AAD5JF40_ACENE|nr:hypothetical protein LWI28_002356 [Acer negundo]